MDTFSYSPAAGPKMSCEPNVETARFGDGYEQRIPKGINHAPVTWSLRFSSKNSGAAYAFLKAKGGYLPFMWTDPLGVTGSFVCAKWDMIQVAPEMYDLMCEFRQVFEQ
jgi:phage-related protein